MSFCGRLVASWFYLLTQISADCLAGISTWISTWWLSSLTVSKTKLLIFFPASQKMATLHCQLSMGHPDGILVADVSHNTFLVPQTHWKFNFQSESEGWLPFYPLVVPPPLQCKLQQLLIKVNVGFGTAPPTLKPLQSVFKTSSWKMQLSAHNSSRAPNSSPGKS